MMQNGILDLLNGHQVVPVVTITDLANVDAVVTDLLEKNISIIEVTLRTDVSLEAIKQIKTTYGDRLTVGAGTVISAEQIDQLKEIGADFMVSPGYTTSLGIHLRESGIAFLPGACTPSEIITCYEDGCRVLKFFPAEQFGGRGALSTYSQVFPKVQFCPTGGITEGTYPSYLELPNVICVGGSWMVKK
jgi:2-dehydro-3-deoxyphosphogluconate aldolase/(4S)-4-hydroxy-2-oxoglutarate aldolase